MKEMAFQQKHLEKSIFPLSKWLVGLWSGRPVLTFWKRLQIPAPILSGMPDFFWAQDSGFHKQKISQISEYGARAELPVQFLIQRLPLTRL